MKKINVIIFISTLFLLGACSDNLVDKNTNNNISDTKIEKVKSDILNINEARIKNILIGEFKKELAKNDSIIIDLRTSKELENTGIIYGAKQIDFYSSDFKDQLASLNKNKKYLIYCRSGRRSGKALSIMKNIGFTNVLELKGGMNNWIASGEEISTYSEGSIMMDNNNTEGMIKNIVTLNAKKWEYDKKEIRVKKGEKLIIKVNNTDMVHGIRIADMKLIGDTEIEIDTSKVGEFEFRCANYCGVGHQDMTGKIIIE